MDRDYIKLCAEMAYNEVIFESFLNEEVLQEGEQNSFVEKFKIVISKIKNFIIKTMNRIIDFIINKIKELKTKIQEINKKRKEKEAKQESVSLYDQLMEITLTEAGINYDNVLSKIHSDIISDLTNKYNNLINLQKDYSTKLLNELGKSGENKTTDFATDAVVRKMNYISNEFITSSNLLFNKLNIEKSIEKFKDKNFDIDKNSYPSEGFLNTCTNICDEYKNLCNMQLKFLDADLKQHENAYRIASKDDELSSNQKDILVSYHRNSIAIINKSTELFNQFSNYFVQTMKLILTLPAKSFTD